MEDGSGMSGRRRRRNAAASIHGHISASHEQVLRRHLLTINEKNKNTREANEQGRPQANDVTSNQNWSQSMSVTMVVCFVVLLAALVVSSVYLVVYRRSKNTQPSNC